MPTKAQAFAQLAENTATYLTNSLTNWTGFLATVGRLYKYPYHEQLMIYAQRPDATACADYELWNSKMNRYVRRGSTGIALLDPTGDTPKLKYVFDVSDTGGRGNSRRPFLWEMREHHEQPILEMLEDKFDISSDNLSDGFYKIANTLAKEYYDNHKEDLPYFTEDSFLEDYDEDNLRITFENATTVSIAYTLMKRCGLDTENYFEHEDFLPIFDFNTSAAVSLLGTAVSEQSEQVFRQISLTIIKTERERSNENERNHLQQERGLSDTQHHTERATDTAVGQVRQDEKNLLTGTPQSPIQPSTTQREVASSSTGNRPNSQQATGADNGRLAENPSATRQDDTAVGMGGTHEQSEIPSGGNHTDGTGVQLTLFPSEQEQIQNIADRQERENTQSQSVFSMPTSEIEYELQRGTGTQGGKLRVYDFYKKNPTEKAAIDFLKNEFGWYGHSHTFSDGTRGFIDYQPSKGMVINYYDTNSKSTIKWTEVEKHLRAIVATDRYLTAEEKARYEEQQLATTGLETVVAPSMVEPQLQPTLTDTVQATIPGISTGITAEDIDTALLEWNGDEDSKARVLAYMQDHSRERGTAEWLKNEYGDNQPAFVVSKGDLSVQLPWAKVQRYIGQLILQNRFFVNDETKRYTVEQTSDAWDEPYIVRDNTIPDNDKDRYHHTQDTYLTYDTEEEAQAVADRLNETKRQATMELTFEMYDTGNPDIFKVKENSYLVSTEIKAPQEIWERFASKGLVPNGDSQQRIVFETDGNNWNRFFIPDTYGNKSNNIKALDVLTSDEYKTMLEVVQKVLPAEEKQTENSFISYTKGDTVYLENGTPFLIKEITDNKVTLRDPSLFYPILRAESRDSFLQLLERYPQTKVVQEQAEDYRITDTHLGEGNKREKFQRNIAAIITLQALERENRFATKEEQETLSQYVGWGGLSEVFDKTNGSYASEYVQLKALLTENEYEMARASTLNAHYTSPTVIKAIYDAVEQMGFTTGNILEPACGTGHFFGMLPESMQDSNLYGVELDSITGRIAKQLYPSANIATTGFEKTDLPDSFFDLAIGNVPFGNYKLTEKRYDSQNFLIHDHFFAKALDKVRPGGIVAFITSKGTMDKKNPAVRRYLAQRAELLGAIRLPNNAFSKNAGTEVTSDIIFLQKRDSPIDVDRDWIHLNTDDNGIALNSYFADHPEMILGNMEMVSGQFGMESTCTPIPDADLAKQLRMVVANIEGKFSEADLPDMEISADTSIPADPRVKNFSYTLVDSEVFYRENSRMVKPQINQTAKERIAGLVGIRECVNNLIHYQLEDYGEDTIRDEQATLNSLYDSFTAKHGLINSRGNSLAFSEDNSYYLLCSLEEVDENGKLKAKADMFTKRTIKKRVTITSVDTASEALALSIAEKAKVDMAFMATLTGKTKEQLVADLQGVVFRVPTPFDSNRPPLYVTADEYLSGNVREKLHTAKLAAQSSPQYMINVEALTTAQPKDLDASEIDVRLGATWIDKEYIEQFMYELFDTPYRNQGDIEVKFAPFTAEWNITNKNSIGYNNVAAYVTYGTDRANAYRILEDSLNLRDVRIYDAVVDPDGKERRVLNKDATTLAQQKQQTIKDEFRDWIFKDADRRQTLVSQYNEKFNSTRPREYDGQHINFNGINPEISLRPHQVNAIAHILYGDNVLLAHEVGAGKTFEMVAAAMESKRLGLCQKPLFAVPNHLTEQWASEFLRLYPAANVLVATKKDFETRNRKKFCARIATGDYDAVIIGHSQFERIPMSLERQERLLRDQIDEILDGIEEVKASGGERFTVKQLERTKKGLEERLDKLQAQERKDDVVTFEQLGVDRLYVDEAHNYKNLFLYTKMRNVAGLSTSDAQKSSDMFLKCRYMDELTGGKGIIFATGTPVSNSMTELYTMQRYLQYNTLQRKGLAHFDCWASTFGETVTAIELAPEGTGYRARTRFSKFFNLPELMSMFKEVANIKVADELDLPTPKVVYETVAVKPTEIQQEMVKELSERAAEVHANKVDPSIDNMLKITSDGRKLGLDQRIVNPLLPDDEGSKVNACVNNLYRIWDESAAEKLTQLVFCDISTPKGRVAKQEQRAAKAGTQTINGVELAALEHSLPHEVMTPTTRFNVYDDIRTKLIEKGVPAQQVAFIHEANTEVRKKELFAKVRNGDVRVLIGSTAKCGAGTNIQDRLVALHDLDCPWRPGDLTQRSGRIERQGNLNDEVNIFRYVTEATFDAYLWQTVENKQKFISQIMTSKSPVRSCEDVDEAALSFAEIKALCAGNPLIKEKMDLDIEVARLKLLKANHQSSQYRLEDNLLKYFPENIEKNKGFIKGFEQDLQTLSAHIPAEGAFLPMVIKGDTLTDKDNAGAAILEACKEIKNSNPVEVGTYRGFTMFLSYGGMLDGHQLTLKGAMSHTAKLGLDARGNLTRIDNALSAMPERLKAVTEQLDNLCKQQEAAKAELGKPFLQEQELKNKVARLATLGAELNMGAGQPQQSADRIAKQERPSILDSLNQPPPKATAILKKSKIEREER